MKGIVFTEFLEMVEDKFGLQTVNDIIENSNLKSEGIYTSIGTYNHMEIMDLVKNLSLIIDVPEKNLFHVYAEYFYKRLVELYPQFFEGVQSPFELLVSVDAHIHKEVKKLYPDAELPRFETDVKGDLLVMDYSSERRMSDFAFGLIKACMDHYEVQHDIEVMPLEDSHSKVRFIIKMK